MSPRIYKAIEHGSPEYEQSLVLRDEVLRRPLGLKFSEQELAREVAYHHLICLEDELVVGCLVLVPQEDTNVRMRQVVVAPHMQRKGIGRGLTEFAEEFAREQGYKTLTLNARDSAQGFYEKLGYRQVGQPFVEVTILHWYMEKVL